jgi:hypothetical protein
MRHGFVLQEMMDSVVKKKPPNTARPRSSGNFILTSIFGQAWICAAGEALPLICSASLQSFREFWTKKIGEISRFVVTYTTTNVEN